MTSGKALIKWQSAFYSTELSRKRSSSLFGWRRREKQRKTISLPILSTAYGVDMFIHCNCFSATWETNWLTQCAWVWLWQYMRITKIAKIQCRISSRWHFSFFVFLPPLELLMTPTRRNYTMDHWKKAASRLALTFSPTWRSAWCTLSGMQKLMLILPGKIVHSSGG